VFPLSQQRSFNIDFSNDCFSMSLQKIVASNNKNVLKCCWRELLIDLDHKVKNNWWIKIKLQVSSLISDFSLSYALKVLFNSPNLKSSWRIIYSLPTVDYFTFLYCAAYFRKYSKVAYFMEWQYQNRDKTSLWMRNCFLHPCIAFFNVKVWNAVLCSSSSYGRRSINTKNGFFHLAWSTGDTDP